MLVEEETRLTLRFTVGTRLCSVELLLLRGDESGAVVREMVRQERLPAYLETPLLSSVDSILHKTKLQPHDLSEAVLSPVRVENAIQNLGQKYDLTTRSETRPLSDEEMFSSAYHWMISHSATTLQKLEASYAMANTHLQRSRKYSIQNLRKRHADDMDMIISSEEPQLTSEVVSSHVRELEEEKMKWATEIKSTESVQKREYREFVINFYKTRDASQASSTALLHKNKYEKEKNPPLETFALYLGSQLKVQYNFEIFARPLLQLCEPQHPEDDGKEVWMPKTRLYSKNLRGLVRITSPDLQFTIDEVREKTSTITRETEVENDQVITSFGPKTGDVIVTRHSNLNDIHVVFHILLDPKKTFKESLAPIYDALRAILVMCHDYDVQCLAIPTSLVNEKVRKSVSTSQWLQHVNGVLKTIKTHLLQSTKSRPMKGVTPTIQLGIPDATDPLFDDVRTLVQSLRGQ